MDYTGRESEWTPPMDIVRNSLALKSIAGYNSGVDRLQEQRGFEMSAGQNELLTAIRSGSTTLDSIAKSAGMDKKTARAMIQSLLFSGKLAHTDSGYKVSK
jgi:hypothetical protein